MKSALGTRHSELGQQNPADKALRCAAVAVASCLVLASLAAQEDLDELMGGFDDATASPQAEQGEDRAFPFEIDGFLKLSTINSIAHRAPKRHGYDRRGYSLLRNEAELELSRRCGAGGQLKLSAWARYDREYFLSGLDNNVKPEAEDAELELGESYVRGSSPQGLDLTFGRQTVVWGKSDSLRVCDLLNPMDLREPGLTDIEHLRLPVCMTRADYFRGNWGVTGYALHEVRYSKLAENGSDFHPLPFPALTPAVVPATEDPESCAEGGYAVALNGTAGSRDLSLYWASINEDLMLVDAHIFKGIRHRRTELYGAAVNQAWGNHLFKSEAAYRRGLVFAPLPNEEFERLDGLLGWEYSGFTDAVISLEAANRHLYNHRDILEPGGIERDEFAWAFRASRTFLNDTLTLLGVAMIFGADAREGSVSRFSSVYDLRDALELTLGAVFYEAGDHLRSAHLGRNDRVLAELKWSF